MKRCLKLAIAVAVVMILTTALCVSVSAFNISDNIERFSVVDEYDGKLYCSYNASLFNGIIDESLCNHLPYGMNNIGSISEFTIKDGKIYYLSTNISFDKGVIHKCNIDGRNDEYIADNVCPVSECFIVGDALYYSYRTNENYNAGIARVSLDTGEYKEIYDDDAYITHCDDNYVYFYSYDYFGTPMYYRISNDGKRINRMSKKDMEFSDGVIHYGKRYNIYDGGIYENDWSGRSKWFANDVRGIQDSEGSIIYPDKYEERSSVLAVINGYIYYEEDFGGRDRYEVYLIRTDGRTTSQIIGLRVPC